MHEMLLHVAVFHVHVSKCVFYTLVMKEGISLMMKDKNREHINDE